MPVLNFWGVAGDGGVQRRVHLVVPRLVAEQDVVRQDWFGSFRNEYLGVPLIVGETDGEAELEVCVRVGYKVRFVGGTLYLGLGVGVGVVPEPLDEEF